MERNIYKIGSKLYVTSDEEIKEGDWFLWKDTEDPYLFKCIGLTDTDSLQVKNSLTKKIGTYNRNPKDSDYGDWYRCYSKKIILTTDPDLITDGVQPIDDEFLEWFVKNPSCGVVETKVVDFEVDMGLGDECIEHGSYYKIILPQEEHKQEFDRSKYIAGIDPIVEETLEEAAEKYLQEWRLLNNIHLSNPIHAERCKNDFIAGAKWQAERMYSNLSKARNELYDKLPTGDIDAFEILKLIKIHLQKLDDLCGNK